MIIKFLLVVGMLLLGAFVLRGRISAGRLALRRLLGVGVLVLGLVAVLFPGAVTWLANKVGVGRGTDLVLYVLVVAFLFVSVALYQRLSDLEARYVTLARRLAIDEATATLASPAIDSAEARRGSAATRPEYPPANPRNAGGEDLAEALEPRR